MLLQYVYNKDKLIIYLLKDDISKKALKRSTGAYYDHHTGSGYTLIFQHCGTSESNADILCRWLQRKRDSFVFNIYFIKREQEQL